MFQTIGKYYETSLRDINKSTSEYFVPAADGGMSCETLANNFKTLETQVGLWADRLTNSTNSKEVSNISKIIEQQTAKQTGYSELMNGKCVVINNGETETSGGSVTLPKPATTTTSGGTIVLLLALGLFLFKDKIFGNGKK